MVLAALAMTVVLTCAPSQVAAAGSLRKKASNQQSLVLSAQDKTLEGVDVGAIQEDDYDNTNYPGIKIRFVRHSYSTLCGATKPGDCLFFCRLVPSPMSFFQNKRSFMCARM